ncbi:hypothetical protein MMC29_004695 [Sticta canariensis]|nr:hypothetical protein [Sticta canariensis]
MGSLPSSKEIKFDFRREASSETLNRGKERLCRNRAIPLETGTSCEDKTKATRANECNFATERRERYRKQSEDLAATLPISTEALRKEVKKGAIKDPIFIIAIFRNNLDDHEGFEDKRVSCHTKYLCIRRLHACKIWLRAITGLGLMAIRNPPKIGMNLTNIEFFSQGKMYMNQRCSVYKQDCK